MKKISSLFKNLSFMLTYSWRIAKNIYGFTFLKIILDTATPFLNLWFPKMILDELTVGRRWKIVLLYIAAMVGTQILLSLGQKLWLYFYVIRTSNTLLNEDIHFKKMYAEMDYANLEDGSVDEKIWFVREGFNAEQFILNKLGGLITAVLQLAGYVYITSSLHPLIAGILLLIILLSAVITRYRNAWELQYSRETTSHQRLFDYFFTAMTDKEYAQDIRLHNAAAWLKKKYQNTAEAYIHAYSKNQRRNIFLDILSELTGVLQTIVMYGYSAYKVALGHITIGSFTVYIGAVTGFVSAISVLVKSVQGLLVSAEYVQAYHDIQPLAIPSYAGRDVHPAEPDFHEITFDHVSFRYRGSEENALDDVCLTIRKGERLSIVGYNGAGKSTLIKLLCRLYEPTSGKILMDGVDISTIKYEQYVDMLSVIFQDYVLFPMSIRDNIGLNTGASDEQIWDALEKSQLGRKIRELPIALDTEVSREFDENGAEFSGGENQKLASARAYCKNTPIVILDEPTAALDPLSEDELYRRFDQIIGDKTAVYITHRLASVKFCDKIAVFEQGKVVEYGTHDSLMKKQGLYFDMFEKQSEYYREDIHEEAAHG